MRRTILLLAVLAMGLALASGVAFSAPASSPDAQADGELETHVIGGTAVPDGKYRYIAAVRFKATPQNAYCGGTLIDRDSVLTAAHCFPGNLKNRPGQFRVFLGRTDMSSNKGVVRDVKRIFRHPDYGRGSFFNRDAAVLKLSRPVSGIPKLKLAPVSSGNQLEKPGTYATVAGWGSTIHKSFNSQCSPTGQENFPKRMREARVPIARDAYAAYVYNDYLPGFGIQCDRFVPQNMVGAGYEGRSTCQGDSGGPLIKIVNRNGKKVHMQIGITSWSAGCAERGYPTVFAEVNSKQIAPFIKSAARN